MEETPDRKDDDFEGKVTFDCILAMHKIDVYRPSVNAEIWYREEVREALNLLGLNHPSATQIIILFRRPE